MRPCLVHEKKKKIWYDINLSNKVANRLIVDMHPRSPYPSYCTGLLAPDHSWNVRKKRAGCAVHGSLSSSTRVFVSSDPCAVSLTVPASIVSDPCAPSFSQGVTCASAWRPPVRGPAAGWKRDVRASPWPASFGRRTLRWLTQPLRRRCPRRMLRAGVESSGRRSWRLHR